MEDQTSTQKDWPGEGTVDEVRRQLSTVTFDEFVTLERSQLQRPSLPPTVARPLLKVLLSPESDTHLLETLKERGKTLSAGSVSSYERATATTIYYAAIASALLHHGRKISRHSYDTLARSFFQLSAKRWMPSELKSLFDRAIETCGNRREAE
jgi:hypothetical protein